MIRGGFGNDFIDGGSGNYISSAEKAMTATSAAAGRLPRWRRAVPTS